MVKDFLAVKVISELDDYFFFEHRQDEVAKQLIVNSDFEGIYKIETTTSRRALPVNSLGTELNEFEMNDDIKWIQKTFGDDKKWATPKNLRRSLSERKGIEFPLYGIYRFFRIIYVSIWFYLMPLLAMSLQFILPLWMIQDEKIRDKV